MKSHNHIEIQNESGERVKALSTVIILASLATDILAFFSPWFFKLSPTS